MTASEMITQVSTIRTQRVLSWLYAQERAETERFRLARVLDETVMPTNVQAFLRMLLGERDEEQQFTYAECELLVTEAHELCARYLLTPNEFLVEYLDIDHGASIVDKLAALIDYPYFGEFLFEWLRANGIENDHAARRAFIRRTEHLAFTNASEEQITEYLQPVHAFYQEKLADQESRETIVAAIVSDRGIDPSLLAEHPMSDLRSLAAFIKSNLCEAEQEQPTAAEPTVAELADEDRYRAFLDELKQAGVHLPMPSKMRHTEDVRDYAAPPVTMFVSKKLRDRTIDELFHGNKFEYQRLLAIIDAATGYDDALLNLETIVHLQKAERSTKLLVKWATVIRMKFQGSETHAVR